MGKEKRKQEPEPANILQQDIVTTGVDDDQFSFDSRYMVIFSLTCLLLGSAVTVYIVLGALYFKPIELEADSTAIDRIAEDRATLFENLRQEKENKEVINAELFKTAANKHLAEFEANTLEVFRKRTTGNNDSMWTTYGSIIFTTSVVTTIGWGNITPKTELGRISCIIYAVFGVPMLFSFTAILSAILNVVALFFAHLLKLFVDKFNARKAKRKAVKKNVSGNYASWPSASSTENNNISFCNDVKGCKGIRLSTKRERKKYPCSRMPHSTNQSVGTYSDVEGRDIFTTSNYPMPSSEFPRHWRVETCKRSTRYLNLADSNLRNRSASGRSPKFEYKQDKILMSNRISCEEYTAMGPNAFNILPGSLERPSKRLDRYSKCSKNCVKTCDGKTRQNKQFQKSKKGKHKYESDASLDYNVRDKYNVLSSNRKRIETYRESANDSKGEMRKNLTDHPSQSVFMDTGHNRKRESFVVKHHSTVLNRGYGELLGKRDPPIGDSSRINHFNRRDGRLNTSDHSVLDQEYHRPCTSNDSVLNPGDQRSNTSDNSVLNPGDQRSNSSDDSVLKRGGHISNTPDHSVLKRGNHKSNTSDASGKFDLNRLAHRPDEPELICDGRRSNKPGGHVLARCIDYRHSRSCDYVLDKDCQAPNANDSYVSDRGGHRHKLSDDSLLNCGDHRHYASNDSMENRESQGSNYASGDSIDHRQTTSDEYVLSRLAHKPDESALACDGRRPNKLDGHLLTRGGHRHSRSCDSVLDRRGHMPNTPDFLSNCEDHRPYASNDSMKNRAGRRSNYNASGGSVLFRRGHRQITSDEFLLSRVGHKPDESAIICDGQRSNKPDGHVLNRGGHRYSRSYDSVLDHGGHEPNANSSYVLGRGGHRSNTSDDYVLKCGGYRPNTSDDSVLKRSDKRSKTSDDFVLKLDDHRSNTPNDSVSGRGDHGPVASDVTPIGREGPKPNTYENSVLDRGCNRPYTLDESTLDYGCHGHKTLQHFAPSRRGHKSNIIYDSPEFHRSNNQPNTSDGSIFGHLGQTPKSSHASMMSCGGSRSHSSNRSVMSRRSISPEAPVDFALSYEGHRLDTTDTFVLQSGYHKHNSNDYSRNYLDRRGQRTDTTDHSISPSRGHITTDTCDDSLFDLSSHSHGHGPGDSVLYCGSHKLRPRAVEDDLDREVKQDYVRSSDSVACNVQTDGPGKSTGEFASVNNKLNQIPFGQISSRHAPTVQLRQNNKGNFNSFIIEEGPKQTFQDFPDLKFIHSIVETDPHINSDNAYEESRPERRQYTLRNTSAKISSNNDLREDSLSNRSVDIKFRRKRAQERRKINDLESTQTQSHTRNIRSDVKKQFYSMHDGHTDSETYRISKTHRTSGGGLEKRYKLRDPKATKDHEKFGCTPVNNYNQNADSSKSSSIQGEKEVLALDEEETAENKVPFFVYSIIASVYIALGGWFFMDLDPRGRYSDGLYFTFVMLTTIGFGDVVPTPERYIILLVYGALGLALANFVTNMMIDKIVDIIETITVYLESKIGFLQSDEEDD